MTNSVVLATLSRSSTLSLLQSQIVALDGQPVTLRVGIAIRWLPLAIRGETVRPCPGVGQFRLSTIRI